jgi:hypothetical protein
MRIEQVALPAMRMLANRPRLAHALFRLTNDESPFDPGYYVDPYRTLEAVRAKHGQVYYRKAFRQWFVVGYDEALELLRSPALSVSSALNVLMDIRPYAPSPTTSWPRSPTNPPSMLCRALRRHCRSMPSANSSAYQRNAGRG